MSDTAPTDKGLAALLARADQGDTGAKEALFAALYAELHRLAQAHIHRAGNVTLSATTLLHEAYLDLAQRDGLAFPDRNRFMGYASRAMRGLVIDYVRQRQARKRGGDLTFTTLGQDGDGKVGADGTIDFDALGSALEELTELEPALAELVDLKFFCGFSFGEIAALRNVSERTVQRDWAKARALLHRFISDND
jgi:RNA polymerase sigma factor (TIGR02999 family)